MSYWRATSAITGEVILSPRTSDVPYSADSSSENPWYTCLSDSLVSDQSRNRSGLDDKDITFSDLRVSPITTPK